MRRRHLPLLCLPLLCLPLLCLPQTGAATSVMRIGSWNRSEELLVRAVEALLAQAYTELGQALQFEERPLRRAYTELLDGALDGNLLRSEVVIEEQAQLLRIDPPLLQLHYWSYGGSRPPQHWQDLAGRRVGMLRGVLLIERQLPAQARRIEAGSPQELQRLLEHGMVDLVLSAEWIHAPPVLGGLERQACGLAPAPLHHVLRRQHQAFAQRLSALLSDWQRSGRLDELLRASLP